MGRKRLYESEDPKERHRLAMRRLRAKQKKERKAYLEEHPLKVFVNEAQKQESGKATGRDAYVSTTVEAPKSSQTMPQKKPQCGECGDLEQCPRKRVLFYSTREGATCPRYKPKKVT